MIDYLDENDMAAAVMINRIVRLSKDWENDITFIHLDTGEILKSKDSMRTLQARINISSRD